MDHCEVCHGCVEAISIFDSGDVKHACSHIGSCHQSILGHVQSHGWRDVSFAQDHDSMEGKLVLRCEVSWTEAAHILC
jgi:hypothetical protein